MLEREETDPLTGLLSKSCLRSRLATDLGSGLRLKELPTTYRNRFLCVDVDNLKHYHDFHGHTAADEAVQRLATCLRELFPANRIYRYGGDEIVVELGDDPLPPPLRMARLSDPATPPQSKYSVVELQLNLAPGRSSHFLRGIELQLDRGMFESLRRRWHHQENRKASELDSSSRSSAGRSIRGFSAGVVVSPQAGQVTFIEDR